MGAAAASVHFENMGGSRRGHRRQVPGHADVYLLIARATTMRKLLFATLLTLSAAAGAATIEMKVDGLVCAYCAQGIEKTLKTKPAVDEVYVSLKHKLVAVTTKK